MRREKPKQRGASADIKIQRLAYQMFLEIKNRSKSRVKKIEKSLPRSRSRWRGIDPQHRRCSQRKGRRRDERWQSALARAAVPGLSIAVNRFDKGDLAWRSSLVDS